VHNSWEPSERLTHLPGAKRVVNFQKKLDQAGLDGLDYACHVIHRVITLRVYFIGILSSDVASVIPMTLGPG